MSIQLERMRQSRRRILLDHREFAPILLRLDLVESEPNDPLNPLRSAAVSWREIRFAPEFVEGLTDRQLDSLQVHETLHPALLHLSRRGTRTAMAQGVAPDGTMQTVALSNIAQDFVVNGFLEESGFAPLPGWCRDKKYDGMSWEQVYDLLLTEMKPSPYPSLDAHDGTQGKPEDTNGQEMREIEREWQKAMADVLTLRKQYGKDSGSLEKMLGDSMDSVVPWPQIVAEQVRRAVGRDDWTWKRPSRRGQAIGLDLPSQFSETIECIAFIFDTSGSMWNEPLLDVAFGETLAALASLRIERAVLIQADVEVHREEDITSTTTLDRTIKGGGGTSFRLALEAASKHRPSKVIYFTDLEGEFPEWCEWPVLWITDRDHPVPFGEVLKIPTGKGVI